MKLTDISDVTKNTYNDFEKIVLEETPLIDVRAPIEFEKGAFINAVNCPIMNDEERHLIGIEYKQKGNLEATKLGHEFVSGEIKAKRVENWKKCLENDPKTLIYCFRGGQRSRISQKWIEEATGKEVPRLDGGYKAFRNYLLNSLTPSEQKSEPIVIGGCTGAGKTILLKKLNNSIDLEGLANHRGSAFGNNITPQPSQVNFENNLAYKLIQHKHENFKYMILEDESRNIGKRMIPKELFEFFKSGKLIILDRPLEERIDVTMDEYVINSQRDHLEFFGDEIGLEKWFEYLGSGIQKLARRLGGERYKKVFDLFEGAHGDQLATGDSSGHRRWIRILLEDYYDPMYNRQIEKDSERIIFRGLEDEVIDFIDKIEND